jgi:serine/threonine-protein kinase RsbW
MGGQPPDSIASGGKSSRMSDQSWSWTSKTSLPSRSGAHYAHMQEIIQALQDLGWNGRDLFGIELSLEESLSNAIRHGNRLDESKIVLVECKATSQRFWIQVRDEGSGFHPEKVPDCTSEGNLECPGGRGLALIKAYMTSVEYNDRGNCVTMEKTRSGEPRG